MTVVDDAAALRAFVGTELGVSSWRTVLFEEITTFAEISGDRQWIHTDRARAIRESPAGDAIAHGFFSLSLVTALAAECLEIRDKVRSVNYGVDRVRFTHVVRPGDRVRLRLTLIELTPLDANADRLRLACVLEIDGNAKPALVAEYLTVIYRG